MLVQIQATHQSASMHRSHEDHLTRNSAKPGLSSSELGLAGVHREKKPTNDSWEGAHRGGIPRAIVGLAGHLEHPQRPLR